MSSVVSNGEITFIFWNCALNPPRVKKKPTLSDVDFVISQISELINNSNADVIVLSEITHVSFDELGKTVDTEKYEAELLNYKTKRSVFDIAIIYRKEIKILESAPLIKEISGTELKVAVKIKIEDPYQKQPISIYASHWPSFRTPDSEVLKTHAATALKIQIENGLANNENIVCMGDYNTEPFSSIISVNLSATNDRQNVIKKPQHWLYNPFWKLLNSRLCFENSGGSHDLGTCFGRSNHRPNWATFDQMFFSASFLRNKGWSIIEEDTGRYFDDSLLKQLKNHTSSINHFPVKTKIRYL